MKDIVFYPWKPDITEDILDRYKAGRFSVLSLDMKPRCNIKTSCKGCVYCSSREYKPSDLSLTSHRIKEIIHEAADYGCSWMYICGASEPFDDINSVFAVEEALEAGMEVCCYTNALSITHKFAHWLFKHKVNLIVKCDSLHESTFNTLMRARPSQNFARRIYKSIQYLLDAGYGKAESPSMALSIVTTTVNYKDIPDVVRFCLKHGLFPVIRHAKIGSVRMLGNKKYRTSSKYREENKHWYLPVDESAFLKAHISDIMGQPYRLPICPSPIAGIHVTHTGKVKIEANTGLSCTAFTTRHCKNVVVGNVTHDSIEEVAENILHYRQTVLHNVEKKRRYRPVFGGCGGGKCMSRYYRILKHQQDEREREAERALNSDKISD